MPHPKVKIADNSGNTVAVDTSGASNALKVSLSASDNIEIGDVDIKLNGTAVSADEGNADAGTIRVTIADDDNQFGAVGAGSSVDGSIHSQLRYIGTAANGIEGAIGADGSTGPSKVMSIGGTVAIGGNIQELQCDANGILMVEAVDGGNSLTVDNAGTFAVQVDDTSFAVADGNALGEGVLVQGDDGSDRKNIHVDPTSGDVQVDVTNTVSVASHAVTNAGTFLVQEDGAALTALQKIDDIQDTIGTDGEAGPSKCVSIAGTVSGELREVSVTTNGYLNVNLKQATAGGGSTDPFKVDTESYDAGSAGIMAKVVCSDTLAALSGVTNGEIGSLQVDTLGALYTTHAITGAESSKNTTVGTSIEDLHGSNVACKRVDMMASPDNTGYIWVGGTNTGAGQGIRLAPGDFYSVDIDNTEDIQVVATVDAEDISYVIYT